MTAWSFSNLCKQQNTRHQVLRRRGESGTRVYTVSGAAISRAVPLRVLIDIDHPTAILVGSVEDISGRFALETFAGFACVRSLTNEAGLLEIEV